MKRPRLVSIVNEKKITEQKRKEHNITKQFVKKILIQIK